MREWRSIADLDSRCGHHGCNGIICSTAADEGRCCDCHLNQPCYFCVEPGLYCSECDWTDEIETDYTIPEPVKPNSNSKQIAKSLLLISEWGCEILSADFATGKVILSVPVPT